MFKPPVKRQARKEKEYEMAVVRTVFNAVTGVLAIISFLFTLLIYHKVYWGG